MSQRLKTSSIWGSTLGILGLYWGYIGIMEKKLGFRVYGPSGPVALGVPIHKPCGGFPKIRGTNLGVPRTRIPAILGNDHIPYTYPSGPLDFEGKAQGSG